MRLLKIPSLGAHPLSAILAIRKLLEETPEGPNKPPQQARNFEIWLNPM